MSTVPSTAYPKNNDYQGNTWALVAVIVAVFGIIIGISVWTTKLRYRALDEAVRSNNPALAAAIMQPTPNIIAPGGGYFGGVGYGGPGFYPGPGPVVTF
jgi:hypothetical protein